MKQRRGIFENGGFLFAMTGVLAPLFYAILLEGAREGNFFDFFYARGALQAWVAGK